MSGSVTKFCEICQVKVEEDVIFNIFNNDSKFKLLPEIDLHLTQNSVICDLCITKITDVQEFRQLQVKNESLPNNNTICVKEEPGVEKIKEEFNVGLVKNEVYELQGIKDDVLVNINNEKYHCYDCGCCTDAKEKLIQHICKQHRKKDTTEKIYQCDKCDYKSCFNSSWKYHKLTHTEKLFKCTQCNYASVSSRGLKFHMYQHTGKYSFQCDKCDSKFTRRSSFKTHMLSQHTDEKPYQCNKCEYKCVYKCNLKNHTLSQHGGEKPYQCDKCDYKSARKDHLKRHKLSHTNEKQYRCTQCKYGCTTIENLKNHMIKHTGEYPFQCDKCMYKSARRDYLKSHILSQHTDEKPYQCDKCNYKCGYKGHLKRHTLSQHAGEKPYQCDKCDYKCSYRSRLKNHTLSRHSGDKYISVISAISKVAEKQFGDLQINSYQ